MKSLTTKILKSCLVTGAALLSLWGGAAFAVSYDLVAGSTTVTMPDGKVVTMWGYGKCASTDATFTNCSSARVPGPPLTVTDGSLTINLQNNLPEPTSIVINGQRAIMTPVWIDPTNPLGTSTATGSRAAGDFTSRVRSFTHEAPPGGTATYTWATFRPGTYLYQTGTHPSKQVQMGLYGAVKADSAAGVAYPAAGALPTVTYAQDVVVLFSEIDPALHDAVINGTFGTAAYPSTIDYKPKYFLINGKPFGLDQVPLNSIPPVTPANPGDTILLRLLNAGLDSREVVVQGERPTLHAEDGNRAPYALQHNGVLLAAGKTLDVTITPAVAEGVRYIPIFDRRLALSTAGVTTPGGMFAYLQVGAAADTLTVNKTGAGTGSVSVVSAPGGLFCGGSSFTPPCTTASQTYITGTELLLRATPDAGSAFGSLANPADGWTGCTEVLSNNDCRVTVPATVTANFRTVNRVTLLDPNGDEPELPLTGGQSYTIRWEAPANAVKFNLAYTLNGGLTWRLIARGVTGTSFNWIVPVLLKDRNNVRVRVVGLNSNNRVVLNGRDRSDFRFSILRPLL